MFSLKNRKNGLRTALAAGLLLTVAGCATPFQARVQHFQQLPPLQGQTFTIVPSDAERAGSLEFASYAQLVSERLRQHGLVPAESSAAQLVVTLDYGSGPGRERLATRNTSMSMGWGWGPSWSRGWRSGWGWGGWGGWGYPGMWGDPWGPEVYSYSVYPAFLDMRIARASDKTSLFEGRADSIVRVNDLTVTVPKLVDALFQNFPGDRVQSGVVKVPTK